jgi:hypothetical protein
MSSSVEHSPGLLAAAVPTAAIAPTADQIADAFDLLARTYRCFREELTEISTCEAPLSQACVDRLVALGGRMQPAAAARTLLARVAPDRVLAGVAVWASRHTPNGSDYTPAALRARRLWAAGGEK